MKRITAFLLALAMLIALSAPALAKEVIAAGQYVMDVNLEVPDDDDSMIGCFTAMIPDGVDLEYGVREKDLFYWIDIDESRMPEGMAVSMDITSDYFREWYYTDEETDESKYDYGFELWNDEAKCGINYRLINGDGTQIQGANYGYEEDPGHLQDGYDRFVDAVRYLPDEDTHKDGRLTLSVDYNTDNLPQPGYYYSELNFVINVNWAFNKYQIEDSGYEYIFNEGYTDTVAEEWGVGDSAYAPNGWPYRYAIAGIRKVDD